MNSYAYITALTPPPLGLANSTPVTLTASIADNAVNTRTQQVQFFVAVVSPQLPTAGLSAGATNGLAPLTVDVSGAGSTDPDGKVVRWEWSFGDATALGRTVTKTFVAGGSYPVTLLVSDTQGGVSTTTRTLEAAIPCSSCHRSSAPPHALKRRSRELDRSKSRAHIEV